MDADRSALILAALAGADPDDPRAYPQRVCVVSARLLRMTGAGLTLPGAPKLGAAWASDDRARALEELQLLLGEGPGLDAVALRRPILAPDLDGSSPRWAFFSRAAMDFGIRAVFAFPLQVGAIDIGVLTLHRDQPGDLSADDLGDALVVVDLVTGTLIDVQARGDLGWDQVDLNGRQALVHQATGMVSVQLNASLSDALVRLRAHSFATGTTIYDVAEQVVSRRLRFD